MNYDWKTFGDLVHQGSFDVVAITNDFDNADDFDRAIRYIRSLSRARIITSGRLSSMAPRVFESSDVDAIATSGDPEAAIADYIDWLEAARDLDTLPGGLTVRAGNAWHRSPAAGRRLDAAEWCLPDISEIPYDAYLRMYKRDESKFCGIPGRRELVVPAARGCPVGCSFCDVPDVQGLRDRRMSVDQVISYIEDSFSAEPFEYVAFYAPTFTLDRKWTRELADALITRGSVYPWKCATTIAHLPFDLLEAMAHSGCVRVSVGLETLESPGQLTLPRQKHLQLSQFRALAERCGDLGVELNCFVIAGLPGTTATGVRRTVEEVRAAGGRVRPTMYGNSDRLRAATTLEEASLFNRQLLHPEDSGAEDDELYALVFGHEPHPTQVMNNVPQRPAFVTT